VPLGAVLSRRKGGQPQARLPAGAAAGRREWGPSAKHTDVPLDGRDPRPRSGTRFGVGWGPH
jgi:hypothetical protein